MAASCARVRACIHEIDRAFDRVPNGRKRDRLLDTAQVTARAPAGESIRCAPTSVLGCILAPKMTRNAAPAKADEFDPSTFKLQGKRMSQDGCLSRYPRRICFRPGPGVVWPMKTTKALLPSDITVVALNARLRDGESVQIVDVRCEGEFAGGRISGAKLMPLAELAKRRHELDCGTPIVLVCQGGQRSTRARDQLAQLGLTNVASMTGGMHAWSGAGLPLERDARAPWALERQVRITAGGLVLLGVGLGWFVHPLYLGLSAFVGAGLVFAGVTDWCGMGLLLARAPWNRRAS